MRHYENILNTSENREKQRAYYIPYESLEKALEGKKENSAYYKLLNGNWNFKYYERDIDVPDNFDDISNSAWRCEPCVNPTYFPFMYKYIQDETPSKTM